MNKFATDESTKWEKKISVRPNGEEHLHFFIYDPELDQSGMVAKARDAYLKAFQVVDGLRAKRRELEAAKLYTSLGLSERLGETAMTDALPSLRRARAEIEKLQAGLDERRAKLVLARPNPADTIGEMQRAEMRKRLAEMPDEARNIYVALHRDEPALVQAIIHAPPLLSGVGDEQYANLTGEQLCREHGPEIEELEALDEVLKTASDMSDKARAELRSVIGCSSNVFDEIAKVAEANDGRAPMRRELRVVAGQEVEIPRVYDIDRKVWRDASAAEIKEFAA